MRNVNKCPRKAVRSVHTPSHGKGGRGSGKAESRLLRHKAYGKPLQKRPYINGAGEEIEKTITAPYLVSDFKKKNGYKRSVELCRIYDIYRQNYCGCTYSIWEEV